MKITKIFTVESSHIVRNCTSNRCSHSVHGHSYKIEVEFASRRLDNAGMVMDFGLMKSNIKNWIDTMDHCHIIWSKDTDEYKNFFKKHNERWIEVPFNPSAEMLSIWIFDTIAKMLQHTEFNNGERDVCVNSVTVHETATGRAMADQLDVDLTWRDEWDSQIKYSDGVIRDLDNRVVCFLRALATPNAEFNYWFKNPVIEQQV